MARDERTAPNTLTLTADDITDGPSVGRRSALAAVGALVGAAVGVVVLAPSEAEACRRQTGRTDSDSGNGADGVNRGHTGMTDSDSGDEANCGRGRGGRAAPRRSGNCTDSDSGNGADGAGHGRNCGGAPRRRCTDSDPSDGVNHGRHC